MISAHISGIIKGVKSIMFEGIGAFFSRLWTDISGWFVNIYDQFCFVFVEKDRYKQMFTGLGNTLKITGGALLVGIVIGIVVAAIRSSYDKNKEDLKKKGGAGRFFMGLLNGICKIYLTVIRGTPVVVQLMISYFLIFVSAQNGVLVGIFAFGINSGAYVAEIFRGGIMSVDEGQFEAGRSLGFGYVQRIYRAFERNFRCGLCRCYRPDQGGKRNSGQNLSVFYSADNGCNYLSCHRYDNELAFGQTRKEVA